MKTKMKSEKAGAFAKGGSSKMAGQSGAAPVVAGQVSLGGRSGDNKFSVKAGGTGVAGKQRGAAQAVAGQVSSGGRGGDNTFKVSGGSGRMAGFTGSTSAKPL